MAERALAPISPWRVRSLTVPPQSLSDWLRLAVWQFWMGSIICALLGFGASMISTSPQRIIKAEDVSRCYATAPVVEPCKRILYLGTLNAAFSGLTGVMLIVAALWLLWELWDSVAPKPITDDFLRILSDSFARDWRDPRTWPWSRLGWAYGFTLVGALFAMTVAWMMSQALASAVSARAPAIKPDTAQEDRVNP